MNPPGILPEYDMKNQNFSRVKTLCILITGMLLLSGCSTTSWTVVSESETDRSNPEMISSELFMDRSGTVSPENPVLNITLNAASTYRYSRRIKAERYIHKYRPRAGFVMAGMAGAALSYYAAFSDNLVSKPTDPQKFALTGTGTALAVMSFMNMKTVGEPIKTGETRLLRKAGKVTETDTSRANPDAGREALLTIRYLDNVLTENKPLQFENSFLNINLVDEINAELIDPSNNEPVQISIRSGDVRYEEEIPVTDIFEQFVIVSARITALRNSPRIGNSNILTDLANGSQLKKVSEKGGWVKVLYGISETYVSADDVYTILRPSEFATDLSVITVSEVPFGSVDVEQDIPEKAEKAGGVSGMIISGSRYGNRFSERRFADRDARLMEEYFSRTLGIPDQQLFRLSDPEGPEDITSLLRRVENRTDPEDKLVLYLSGYAETEGNRVFLAGGGNQGERISLNDFFREVGDFSYESVIVFADLDFRGTGNSDATLNELAGIITDTSGPSAVIFASGTDQVNGEYTSDGGEQYRHSIFSYYIAEALKQGRKTVRGVFNHLQRNVSFTSRRIYDRPQQVRIFGNADIELTN